jgi:serine/threonine-protein kinase RsbW
MRKKLGQNHGFVRDADPPVPAGRIVFQKKFSATTEEKNVALNELLAALQTASAITSESEEMRMRLCLDEALVNAVMHGNKFDASKTVTVGAYSGDGNWQVMIEDEGEGFREEDLPDPNAAENMLEESGRGVHLMRNMMDEVSYWRGGRVLLLSRKIN